MQYSAFELELTARERRRLMLELEKLRISTGHVSLYPRAGGSAKIGKVPEDPFSADRHAWVIAT